MQTHPRNIPLHHETLCISPRVWMKTPRACQLARENLSLFCRTHVCSCACFCVLFISYSHQVIEGKDVKATNEKWRWSFHRGCLLTSRQGVNFPDADVCWVAEHQNFIAWPLCRPTRGNLSRALITRCSAGRVSQEETGILPLRDHKGHLELVWPSWIPSGGHSKTAGSSSERTTVHIIIAICVLCKRKCTLMCSLRGENCPLSSAAGLR